MAFSGLGPDALGFLKALAFHQNKEWFDANRDLYETQLKGPLGDLVEHLSERFAEEGVSLKAARKGGLFRLNRDVRFSKNKDPYKTNAGAILSRTGTKKEPGLVYIHIDPNGCFLAAGFYRPEPPDLARLRRAIAEKPARYGEMVQKLAAKDLVFSAGYALTRPPRGLDKLDDPVAVEGVKHTSFIVSRPVPADGIVAPAFAEEIVIFARDALPLLDWGWAAVDMPD